MSVTLTGGQVLHLLHKLIRYCVSVWEVFLISLIRQQLRMTAQ